MTKVLSKISTILLFILLFASCKEATLTERKQLILIPESSEILLGDQAFSKIIKEANLSRDKNLVKKVKKVGLRIAKAADRPNYKWEFAVIEDDSMVNAFCLPADDERIAQLEKILRNREADNYFHP